MIGAVIMPPDKPSPPSIPLGRQPGQQNHPQAPTFAAFGRQSGPISIPVLRLSSSAVLNASTNHPIFIITADAYGRSATVLRAGSGQAMGNVEAKSTRGVEVTLAGLPPTRFKYDNPSGMRQIFTFEPRSYPGMTWYWTREKKGLFQLADHPKQGQAIATLEGDVLLIGTAFGLGENAVDEIVLSAIAMLKKDEKTGESLSTSSGMKAGFQVVNLLLGGGIGGS